MKAKKKVNYRVEVEPDSRWMSEQAIRNLCESMCSEIKRHVDGVRLASVIYDIEETCSHCGREWTEASQEYNGGCCDADEAAEMERRKDA